MKEIFIKEEKNYKKIYLIENNIIIGKHEENIEKPMQEGNIYIGKVQNILPGMQAAFINIGSNKNVFIHLKDILEKTDVKYPKTSEEDKININDIIKPGDPLLVQVTRDNNYKKGARVTTHISLTGRFFVYMPKSPFVTASQKIEDEKMRKELIAFAEKILPENSGGIIRTSSLNAEPSELKKDIKNLIKKWENIKQIVCDKYPKEIYNAGGIIEKYLLDNFDKGLDKIVVDNRKTEKIIKDILKNNEIQIPVEIKDDYLSQYDYEKQLLKLESRKIWLDCGGFITIDKTEALTAIDVNSGKYIGKSNLEDTVFKVNQEATVEIAKQLMVRDIGGIVIIDYIDMHIEENKEKILKLMEKETKKDNSKVQIEGFTKLNLLEMTRKHIYSN